MKVPHELSFGNDFLRLYPEVVANELTEFRIHLSRIDIASPQPAELRDNVRMKRPDRNYFLGVIVRNFEREVLLYGHDEFNGVEAHKSSNDQVERPRYTAIYEALYRSRPAPTAS